MSFALLPILAFLCYLTATVAVTQRLYHAQGPKFKLVFTAATAGIVLHMLALSQAMFAADGQNFSLLNVSSLVCWLITLSLTLTALRTPITLLLPIVYGFAAMVQLAVGLLPGGAQVQHFENNPWLLLHVVVAFIAYVMLIMATLYSFQVSYISQRLKQKTPLQTGAVFPPLMQAEELLFRLVLAGTILLGLTLLSGAIFTADWLAKHNIHKNVLSLIAFLLFSLLLVGHARLGWRGRVANALTISASLILTLAYFGSRFVREVLLERL
ncbi:MAG: cytochrome c biogenesis protein CcsA [Gammaproteobacteria bacterium]|nr:cytochrome c biogenesis protein CcsA [Gammaproteobacteria bacterium]MBU2179364.1 cytochrome c biogenesis protein CcsA [Gammaproteobacteria bacterium]MBU2278395.1 cytochrome c biogenesis protein CcsA [Gammaproteobacteria bacterium]